MARIYAATVIASLLVGSLFSACASAPEASESTPEASSPAASSDATSRDLVSRDWRVPSEKVLPASTTTRQWLTHAIELAKPEPLLTRLLLPNEEALLADSANDGPLKSSAYRTPMGDATDALFFSVGTDSLGGSRLSPAPEGGLSLTLTRQGARAVAGELDRGRLVFPDAFQSTDVVIAAGFSQVEELLILKDARAPQSFSWRVDLGSELSRLEAQLDGSLLARTSDGVAVLRIRPARLIDSQGRSRGLTWHWHDSRLSVDVDARGLSYPLLLDPMAEAVVWAAGSAGLDRTWAAVARLGSGGLQYGGMADNAATMGTTQVYSGGAWSTLTTNTSPGPLRQQAMAFEGTTAVMFGGTTGAVTGKTWLWTGSDWQEQCAAPPCATAPSARVGPAMAFAGSNKALLFGGNPGGDETWEYSAGDWTKKCTPCASQPTARSYTAMAYAGGATVLLFGGNTGAQDDETWLWSGSAWSKKCTGCVAGTTKPKGRDRHAMVWDEHRKKVVLFGGKDTGGNRLNDTWEWDGANDVWVNTASSGPGPRDQAGLFYDMASKRVVLYGGTSDSVLGLTETWLYHGHGSDCTTASDCNTGFCQDSKCCETACNTDCRTCAGTNWGVCQNVGSASGVEDADSCTGTESCNAAGVCKLTQGEACTLANGSECLSGNCVDGHCCDTACSTACKTCNNSQGTCSNIAKYSTDNAPACSGTNACDGSGACKEVNGQTCSAASECASGYCIDGRCCESDCTAPCKSCGNATGTCTTNVAKGSTDTNASPACSGNNSCDGAGTCKKANGQGCGSDGTQCASGFCADTKCCDTACTGDCNECGDGSCSTMAAGQPGNPSCAPYACNGTSTTCPATCANDTACAGDHYCNAGACVPDQAVGAACVRKEQCSGNQNCVDGFCCDGTCTGACNACSNAKKGLGADGVCGVIVDGGTPRAPGCTVSANKCFADGKCDGAGDCRDFAPNTTPCGAGTICTADNQVSGQLCDGTGVCQAAGTKQPCAPARCVGGACNTSCANDDECDEAAFCAGNVCSQKVADGDSCGANNECETGYCVDGICCNTACEGGCQSCSTGTCLLLGAGDVGKPSCSPFVCDGDSAICPDTCTNDDVCVDTYFCKVSDNVCQPRVNGVACTDDDQCPDKHCVDGVCCESACDGQCEACDSEGKCNAVKGEPVAPRDACPGHPDCAGSCDGDNRAECTGAKEVGALCGELSCEANIARNGACDAAAKCKVSETACEPFVCDATACKEECASDGDCQTGFICEGKACKLSSTTCSDDGTSVLDQDGNPTSCGAFVCKGGVCLMSCSDSTECQEGQVCNTAQGNGVCEPIAATNTEEDSGCGCRAAGGSPGRNGYPALLVLSLVGLLQMRRRRSGLVGSRRSTSRASVPSAIA